MHVALADWQKSLSKKIPFFLCTNNAKNSNSICYIFITLCLFCLIFLDCPLNFISLKNELVAVLILFIKLFCCLEIHKSTYLTFIRRWSWYCKVNEAITLMENIRHEGSFFLPLICTLIKIIFFLLFALISNHQWRKE